MDVRYVRAVREVARTANMAHAAANLNMSQPALSRQIQSVERELGVCLFDRTGRGMRLSDAGEALLNQCTALTQAESSLREAAEHVRDGRLGTLSIGATPQMIERLVAPFLKRFCSEHPDVKIQVVESGGSEVLERVEADELRIGVAVAGVSQRLVQRPLADMRLLAIGRLARRDGTAARRPMSLKEACDYPILALRDSFGSRRLFDSACRLEDLHPSHVFETSAPDAALAMVVAGQGLAVLPSSIDLRGTGLAAVPLVTGDGSALSLRLVAAYDPKRQVLGYVIAAIDGLAKLAGMTTF